LINTKQRGYEVYRDILFCQTFSEISCTAEAEYVEISSSYSPLIIGWEKCMYAFRRGGVRGILPEVGKVI
jgi:hypothetical protein